MGVRWYVGYNIKPHPLVFLLIYERYICIFFLPNSRFWICVCVLGLNMLLEFENQKCSAAKTRLLIKASGSRRYDVDPSSMWDFDSYENACCGRKYQLLLVPFSVLVRSFAERL
jgi:hypothetical protein